MFNIVRNRKFKKTILILLGLYIMMGASLSFIQEKILFRPTVLPQEYHFQFSQPFEEVFLKSNEKAVINALHFKSDNPKGVILYFHGNAGDLSRWGWIAEDFVKHQYDVFIMDYRTYGKSTGTLSEKALYEDAQLCYNYVLKQYSESNITLYGRSLGTGIAAQLASSNQPKQLLLETPYYSMLDVAQHRFPIFPVKHLLNYEMPTFKFAKNINCPITIFHGTDDSVVPFESGKKLFNTLPKQQAKFIKIDGGNHNNLIEFEAYQKGVEAVLN